MTSGWMGYSQQAPTSGTGAAQRTTEPTSYPAMRPMGNYQAPGLNQTNPLAAQSQPTAPQGAGAAMPWLAMNTPDAMSEVDKLKAQLDALLNPQNSYTPGL